MGCFLGCFGGSKDKKRRKRRNDQRHGNYQSLQATVLSEGDMAEKLTTPVPELRDKSEEQLSLSIKKRVTFDSTVTTYEHVSVHESTESLLENYVASDKEREENLAKSSQLSSLSEEGSITSSVGSYPPNHRYQNCRDSDDEVEDSDYEDCNMDVEDWDEDCGDYDEVGDDGIVGKKVWSESVPTALPESRTEVCSGEVVMQEVEAPMTTCGLPQKDAKAVGLNQIARDRSVYVHPVLNPVENLTQWKALKSKGIPQFKAQKENFTTNVEAQGISFSSKPSFKQSSVSFKSNYDQHKNPNQEIAIDASLSTWLGSGETTSTKKTSFTGFEPVTSEKSVSQGSNSITSFDDRPILGALTVDELKQLATSSPRKSPSQSLDEMPIIGTVGRYWNHTGQADDCGSASSFNGIPNTTSKYREDKRVNWHSTPFETRLERALNRATEA